jgi:hypothetical protein
MFKAHVLSAATLALLALTGCATIARGSKETFVVETAPNGARVVTSLGQACDATPCAFTNMARNEAFTVTISKDGYQPETRRIGPRVSGGGAAATVGGNILPVISLVGVVVDAKSGAIQDLKPNPLRVALVAADAR